MLNFELFFAAPDDKFSLLFDSEAMKQWWG